MSIGKTMTGTMAMMLVDQGKLQLDIPITNYLPWLEETKNPYNKTITLRSLLSHSLGLTEPEFSQNGNHNVEETEILQANRLENYVKSVFKDPSYEFPTGKFFKYDNFEAAVIGLLIQQVSGKPYHRVMEEELFIPLGMKYTRYQSDEVYAMGHKVDDENNISIDLSLIDDFGHYPGIMTMTSITDLSKFVQLHLHLGNVNGMQLVSELSMGEMNKIQKDFNATTDTGFGFNLIIETYQGIKRLKNIGGGWGYVAKIIFRPEDKLGFLYVANLPSYDLQVKLKEIINELFIKMVDQEPQEFRMPSFNPNPQTGPSFVGKFVKNANEFIIKIKIMDY